MSAMRLALINACYRSLAHPGTRSTQSPQPLLRLKMEIIPSWVPTATFVSLQSNRSADDRGNGTEVVTL